MSVVGAILVNKIGFISLVVCFHLLDPNFSLSARQLKEGAGDRWEWNADGMVLVVTGVQPDCHHRFYSSNSTFNQICIISVFWPPTVWKRMKENESDIMSAIVGSNARLEGGMLSRRRKRQSATRERLSLHISCAVVDGMVEQFLLEAIWTGLQSIVWRNKLAKLRRHASRIHFALIHFG